MKILITGATGFIGRHLVDYLLKKNYEVIATSNKSILDITHKNLTYLTADLNQQNENYFKLFNCPDLAIHLAWENLPNYKELFHIERNLWANYLFLKNLIQNGLKDLTVMGTCLEYGLLEGCLKEDTPCMPVTSYGLAKDSLRKFLEVLNIKYSFNFKWIRLFYLYGKGQTRNSLLEQLNKAIERGDKTFKMTGGNQLRDYLTIEQVVEYTASIALQKEITGIINCCSGKPISVYNLVNNRLHELGKSIELELGYYPYSDHEPMVFWGDNSRLMEVLSNLNNIN